MARRRSPSGSACRCSTRCSPPTTRPVPDLSRRAFLALAATVVVGAACSDDDDSAPTSTAAPPGGATATGPLSTSTPASTSTSTSSTTSTTEPAPTTTPLAGDPFTLGVTAGDPDATSVVLWTRLVGAELPDAVDVTWETSTDDFATVASSATVTAMATDGHSVHVVVDVDGPVTYRFHAGGFTSAAGRAAPAVVGAAGLKIGAVTCQHFETGYYAAHGDLAEWAPDAVVFLGDFIYEGAARPVGADGVVRSHDGPEPTDIAGY